MSPAILRLATKSLANRGTSALLTILAIALSVMLFLGVEKIRSGAKESFNSTISQTDLIIGARSGSINLLLYTVFRLGDPTGGISWDSYERIDNAPGVAWTIPISLGDAHRGYRVVGTSNAYFEHYRYGGQRALSFAEGGVFASARDVVVGAEVARALNYALGDPIIVSHGIGDVSFDEHNDHPLRVTGILAPTGTPVDRSVHVTLAAIGLVHGEDIHEGDAHDDADHGAAAAEGEAPSWQDYHPEQITSFLLGMDNPIAVLRLQRQINTYPDEALSAIIPGVALAQLWQVVGAGETALFAISVFVVFVGLISVLTSLSASINARRREMAILRATGARAGHVFGLLISEAALLAFLGALAGIVGMTLGMGLVTDYVATRYGLDLGSPLPGLLDIATLVGVTLAGALMGVWPARRALRNALSDGLSVKL